MSGDAEKKRMPRMIVLPDRSADSFETALRAGYCVATGSRSVTEFAACVELRRCLRSPQAAASTTLQEQSKEGRRSEFHSPNNVLCSVDSLPRNSLSPSQIA